MQGEKMSAKDSRVRNQQPPEIVWNEKEGKFETLDKEAFLEYKILEIEFQSAGSDDEKKKKRVMDIVHTYVPPSKRGMGMASLLCNAALAHAKEQSLLVIPTCTYVSETYLPRNLSWKSIVYAEDHKSNM